MSIKFELVSFELGAVLPYGWAGFPGKWDGKIMGHEFTMVGVFKLVSTWSFSKSKALPTLPALRWAEREFWWEGNSSGGWTYKGESDKGDLYLSSPRSPTWGGFAQGINEPYLHQWVSQPGFGIPANLRPKLLSTHHQQLVRGADDALRSLKASSAYTKLVREKDIAVGQRGLDIDNALWYSCAEKIAEKKVRVTCAALDRPGMALGGGNGISGGGFTSKTTSVTRRRVLQFDLGVVGGAGRFTATQVLETCDGKPSISKFIIPGQSDDWVKNIPEDYLAFWRSRLNLANVEDQSTQLESQREINDWLDWCKRMDRVTAVRVAV